jgi:hypothetical protein
VRLSLKIAILRSGRSQRAIGLDARIPETRLSDLVRGRAWPTPSERDALVRVLGHDYFEDGADVPAGAGR